jgi:hypothetical protein
MASRLVLKMLSALCLIANLAAYGDETPLLKPSTIVPEMQQNERVDRWKQDLAYLENELPKRHPDLYSRMTKKAFKEAAGRLNVSIPTLADHQITVEMMKLVAMAGDAHTFLFHSKTNPFHGLPVEIRWFSDGAFVVGATKPNVLLIGQQVMGIGGVPWEEAAKRLALVRPWETQGWRREMVSESSVSMEILNAVGLAEEPSRAFLLLKDRFGTQTSVVLDAISYSSDNPFVSSAGKMKPPETSRKQNGLRNWFRMYPDRSLLYVRYYQCEDEAAQTVADFCGKVIAELDADMPRKILVDLRNNFGGPSSHLRPLIEFLQRRPEFKDRLYVALDGRTFSSGVINAYELKKIGGTLIGEPAGSPMVHFGDTMTFTLPNSGLVVTHSTRLVSLDRWKNDALLIPDIPIETNSLDWFAGKDPIMEHVVSVNP